MSSDTCPISTAGLRKLVEMLTWLEPESVQAELQAQSEARAKRARVDERLEAAFGFPVSGQDVSLDLVEVEA